MDAIMLQLRTDQGYIPWYCTQYLDELSESHRQQVLLQITFLQTYLTDKTPAASRAEAAHAIKKLSQSTERTELPSEDLRFRTRLQKIESIVGSDILAPTKTQHKRRYAEALWLTSRLWGKERAIALGLAADTHDNLRMPCYLHLFSHLEPSRRPSREIVRHVVPLKRSHDDSGGRLALGVDERPTHFGSDKDVSPTPATLEDKFEQLWSRVYPKAKAKAEGILTFLCSLCSLGAGEIPEVLLLRMMATTEIWAPNGYTVWVRTPDVNIVVKDLISGRANDFFLLFVARGLIHERSGPFGRKTFTISSKCRSEYGLSAAESAAIAWPQLVLICHAFPGQWEEKWFDPLTPSLSYFQAVQGTADSCEPSGRIVGDPTLGYKVLLALILSTKVPGARWKRKAIELAESIFAVNLPFGQSDFLYLKGLLLIRKLEMSRRVGSIHFDNAGDIDPPVDSRSNCVRGIELRYLAQGCIMQDPSDLDKALAHLNKFKTQTWPSAMERHELDLQEFMRCKITRWKGQFEEAAQALMCLEDRLGDRYDEIGCAFWSHYIGTLCELHEFEAAKRHARVAVNGWLHFREAGILEEGQKRHRLLRLTLAETLLSAGLARYCLRSGSNLDLNSDLIDAASILEDLDQEYKSITTKPAAGKEKEALKAWEELQVKVQYCREKEQITGFLEMVVYFAQSDLAARAKDYNKSHEMLRLAHAQFERFQREHWWTCVGTDFLNLLRDSLAKECVMSGIE
ncbi:hypothetical protein N7448_011293 [Penicillium atrosanguineum]|nr:hypothetical protein N7448_011293 [Penicillium atrosanguineum]